MEEKQLNYKKIIIPCIAILLIGVSIFFWYRSHINVAVVKFFPINNNIYFLELGSDLEIYKGEEENYKVVGESWSQTNEKVYLRQDVNLLFQNGFLKQFDYPWKKDTDWIIDKLEMPLNKNSIYSLLSYHHAEIHKNNLISSSQAVTEDKLYVGYSEGRWNIFKIPKNDFQKKEQERLISNYKQLREELLEQGLIQMNINKNSYEIYDLDSFSLEGNKSDIIREEQWESVLGGLWEGLYNNYITYYSKGELEYFSPPMPWVLLDKEGTHILVIYQKENGEFDKLIMAIE